MQNHLEFDEIDLLKSPPNLEELQYLAGLAGLEVKEMLNRKSQSLKKLQPDLSSLLPEEAAALIQEDPRILIRPLLTDGTILLSGFKEEKYQQLLVQQ
ncbi:MAG: hypothetical protein GX119_00525 [Syntrophomonadaceae bacterium]|jgi:Spx/MgsR family transcriptional regulator|nr:hypothetical protein [Syntrophomonadaceae bacterium]